MVLLNGRKVSKLEIKDLKRNIKEIKIKFGITPTLAILTNNEDIASQTYFHVKQRIADIIGVKLINIKISPFMKTKDVISKIKLLNNNMFINGIMIQLPIYKNLDYCQIVNTINQFKDIDGCNPLNLGKLWIKHPHFVSATSLGIIKLLKYYNIKLDGKNVVIIGRSSIVGIPLSAMFLNENATVSITHKNTKNLKKIIDNADILCTATGVPHLINSNLIHKDLIIVDIGMNYENGHLMGDVDFEDVSEKVKYITPVPGGVGPMTVISLMSQLIKATKEQMNNGCITR